MRRYNLKEMLGGLWTAPFFAAGWIAGMAIKLYRVANAALILGWKRGSTL